MKPKWKVFCSQITNWFCNQYPYTQQLPQYWSRISFKLLQSEYCLQSKLSGKPSGVSFWSRPPFLSCFFIAFFFGLETCFRSFFKNCWNFFLSMPRNFHKSFLPRWWDTLINVWKYITRTWSNLSNEYVYTEKCLTLLSVLLRGPAETQQ